ncbi:glycoside hydrolase family 2 [Aurantiacibacter luteus]|uniref:Glycoside hydrolase n=1 Tax=Aurantiacibacter luteus TaxID=1581420 RepID=A0A0G9MKZ7_9SPHN|nr:glycoside hydrolase family 2 [Aurantiacibacter luteus]KLE31284.1 glycoside hydrolase [Aurantiacibacter luteus]
MGRRPARGLGLLALTIGTALASASPVVAQGAGAETRRSLDLDTGWQFNLVGPYAGDGSLEAPDPGAWQVVAVPHTWNRVGYYLSDPEQHINSADNVEKTQGVGWYYRTFESPRLAGSERTYLEFDAVSRTAEVWVNGRKVGENRNPFGRFRLDVTDALRMGGANELYVKVDNTQPAEGNSTAEVLPMTGDFFVRGGIYRPVRLIVAPPVHFDLLDHGGPGVYASTASIAPGAARLNLSARIANSSPKRAELAMVASLIADDGHVVGSQRSAIIVPPGETAEIAGEMALDAPRLWNGVDDPYLHTLRFDLFDESGALIDRIDQPFGVREMRIDPERGFFLNGRPHQLRGAGFHQDTEASDWAVAPGEVERSMQIMRDMGANSVRLAHYQHGAPVHEIADRMGMVLWDEIGLVTAWTNAPDQVELPGAILANARQQLLDLVHQNYNHASVAVWGIANEVDFGPGRPDFLGRPPEVIADPMPLLENLAALSRELDPLRPVVLANCCEERGMQDVPVVAEAVDAVGANRYFGWYYGAPDQLGEHLDTLRAKHPDIPLSVSEYGAGGAPNMHSDNPLGGPIDMGGRTQPEEFATWFHEENWRELAGRDDLWGIWLWNAFDFGTTVRAEGDAQDINTKGLVTYDREIAKDAYYFYRAVWSDEPTVHVQGRRYVDRAYPVTDIRVNSNAASTGMTVNGAALPAQGDCDQNVCVWRDVRLARGENVVVARARFGEETVEDRVVWQLDAAQEQSFRIDSGTVVAAAAEVQFGSDTFFDGGTAGSTDQRGGRGRQAVTAEIAGTQRRDIVASFREGAFSYRVPTGNGRYRITLTFVEPTQAAGARIFDVTAEGDQTLLRVDVAQRAGGTLRAVTESFETVVADGVLDLGFVPVTGEAIVSAIEIAPAD